MNYNTSRWYRVNLDFWLGTTIARFHFQKPKQQFDIRLMVNFKNFNQVFIQYFIDQITISHPRFYETINFYVLSFKKSNSHMLSIFISEFVKFLEIIVLSFLLKLQTVINI